MKRKSLNYDLLEESREVEGYPELNKLLNLLSKDEEFNKLLNPLEFKNVAESKQKLINNVIVNIEIVEETLRLTAYKFLEI